MKFTIEYSTTRIPRDKPLIVYRVTFDTPNGERHTTWYMFDIYELFYRVESWIRDMPIKDWDIKSVIEVES